MRLQFHPASARRTVATVELDGRNQVVAIVLLFAVTVLLAGLPLSAAFVLTWWRRQAAEQEARTLNARRREAVDVAVSGLRQTDARLSSDEALLARIALLYDQPGIARLLTESSPAAPGPDERLAQAEQKLARLSASLARLAPVEAENPAWPAATPSVAPLPESSFVVASAFGSSYSKLTLENVFETGLELAAPAGSPVFAAADGVVRWTGNFPLRLGTEYSHEGRIVAIEHLGRYVTIYGRLDSISVVRGQRVRRGARLGVVGVDPILGVPRLRYEVWKNSAVGWVPLDPRLAMLDSRQPGVEAAVARYLSPAATRGIPPLPDEFR